ncbi:uncharacterized protein LOC100571585 isoform X2 [Acyrthosiphon pisum]|uniref:Uncharacterized protein n=1 Tax=Acyrthosiphon pisum TaxID=7029 RepID=A0A8R2ABK9_ACYPI|nr:uncharacterized protein LOC100571585 isoform X2 [Acyrthosiphon pisum]|eukprot:XP_003245327.1 PREDICTED: uncharacterized protein LOC100571585 isoform X2 [Acyrthosiphon pisum]
MTESFEAFPEVVFADATYKLLDLRLPVYVLMTEDGNGQSEIAAIGLLVNEEEVTLRWFFETFKKKNPISAQTRVYVTDKDMKERNVIKQVFPNSALTICLFHTLRTFNREITCDKRNITPNERDTVKEVIQSIVYCKSEMEYNNLYQHLKTIAPETVMEYYNKNWHLIRDEWVIGMTYMTGNFMNKTNNRLESFNGKLKSVISCFSTLENFVEKLFIVLKCIRLERDKNAVKLVQKHPIQMSQTPELHKYYDLLTPYAYNFLKKQFEYDEESITKNTTENTCSCIFYNSMRLPCHHIFKVRKQSLTPLFDPDLCEKRWTRNYYYKTQRVFQNVEVAVSDSDTTVTTLYRKKKKVPTTHEKFRKATLIGAKISELISQASNVHFYRKIEQLECIYNNWLKGHEVSIQVLDVDNDVTDDVENEDLGNYNRQDNYPDNDVVYGNDKTTDAGCSENINNQGIKSIILPGKVRTCGRPKGAILTTIGLRRPRTKRTLAQKPETKIQKKGNRDIAVDPDEPTYCLCVQISYGEMICCDNDSCPIEWFHFSCVSLLTKPKGKWFCPRCRGDRPNKIKPKA